MFCRMTMVAMLALVGGGCKTTKPTTNPVGVMLDRGKPAELRIAAAQQAHADRPNDKHYQAALRQLAVQMGHPTELRTHAIDTIVQQDETRAKRFFRHAIVRMEHWATLTHLCEVAVERQWVDFIPALVRSYQRESQVVSDDERPERTALMKLSGAASLEDAVFSVFNAPAGPNVSERASAWALLCRFVVREDERRRLLATATSESIVVQALQESMRDFGIVPAAREDVIWLVFLHTQGRRLWNAARDAAAQLHVEQRTGIEPRHLPMLAWCELPTRQSRQQLLQALARSLAAGPAHLKVAPKTGNLTQHPQQLADWADQLSWGDLALMHIIRGAMRNPRVTRAWFKQADADMKDQTTEYGGLLVSHATKGLLAKAYPPLANRHDRTFIPPPEMVADGYESIAHYHFHVQQHDNIRYASPGSGDRKNIGDRYRLNGIVLTFIDANTLNVDFYRHGGVVIDLGEVRR